MSYCYDIVIKVDMMISPLPCNTSMLRLTCAVEVLTKVWKPLIENKKACANKIWKNKFQIGFNVFWQTFGTNYI